jgi:hypothetical protein
LFEVDGHLIDRKTHPLRPPGGDRTVAPGEPIHDLWVRVVFTGDLEVRDIVTASDAVPYPMCQGGGATLRDLVGTRIAPGWTQHVKQAVAGARSCTHLMELLLTLGTAAYQTITHIRLTQADDERNDVRPAKIDSCFAYASNGPIVLARWPQHYRSKA